MRRDLKLLDCTLRDGGYINDWRFGFGVARDVVMQLTRAGIDVVEVGFLRNVDGYDPDVTVCNRIEDLNKLLPEGRNMSMYSAMAMRSNYDIEKLSPYSGEGIEMIRITAHDYDIEDGMQFAREVKARGYKLSINPINIMGYSDSRILWLIEQANIIHPYQFSIVDTFGSMRRRDLDRIVSLVDNNLEKDIRVGLHLHENMAMSAYLAQCFIDKGLDRPVTIDGSLMGMGRIPGNLPIELAADYLNDRADKAYDIDYLMDAIQDHIEPVKGKVKWGYTPEYFLSAKFNLHRNYSEHYLGKGDLTSRDINHILSQIDPMKKTVFDAAYADELYNEYKDNRIDDSEDWAKLERLLGGRDILAVAPGPTIASHKAKVQGFIADRHPIVIGVNFVPEAFEPDCVFFSNNKRFSRIAEFPCKVIVTSNIASGPFDFRVNHNSVSGAFDQGCNSLIMLLKMLKGIGVKSVSLAGADGYSGGGGNYYDATMRSSRPHDNSFNIAVADAIKSLGVEVNFITPSKYDMRGLS